MRKTAVAALLGLLLTGCDPAYSIDGTVELPPEALGKPLILHYVEPERLGRQGLPDPYVVQNPPCRGASSRSSGRPSTSSRRTWAAAPRSASSPGWI